MPNKNFSWVYYRIQVTDVWCLSPPGLGGTVVPGGGMDMGGGNKIAVFCMMVGKAWWAYCGLCVLI